MNFRDLIYTFLIIIIFFGLYYSNIFLVQLSNIKNNWPKHRCNPLYMPFAGYLGHDPVQNFTYCIQNMQTNYMDFLLQPLNYIGSILTKTIENVLSDIQFIQSKIEDLTGNLVGVVQQILGIFINILIEFQKIIITLKDTFGKVIGVVTTSIYVIEGSMMTGQSIIRGPIGKTMRTVCFHSDTPIKTIHGYKKIKDIQLDECLSTPRDYVSSIYKFDYKQDKHNQLYALWSSELNQWIYVTAQHYILYKNKWIHMHSHPHAIPVKKDVKNVYCLTTSSHRIYSGEYEFWDWEDDTV